MLVALGVTVIVPAGHTTKSDTVCSITPPVATRPAVAKVAAGKAITWPSNRFVTVVAPDIEVVVVERVSVIL